VAEGFLKEWFKNKKILYNFFCLEVFPSF